ESDGRNWSFQLMGDRINKAVLLITAANLADQEDGVYDQTGDDQGKQNDPENELRQMPAVHYDPAHIQENSDRYQAGAQGDEEGYFFVSSGHGDILLDRGGCCGNHRKSP